MANGVRTRIYNRSGVELAEIDPDFEFVNWRLNNVAMARFVMSMKDSRCTQDNLRPGNLLLVEFENGLPDWGGVIDLPRVRQYGEVSVTAYSADGIWLSRRTPKSRYFTAAPPGTIFQTLIEEEHALWPTKVTIGDIYGGGVGRTIEYHYHQLAKRFKDLARLTGMDFWFEPVLEDGVLSFTAHWTETRGSDRSGTLTLEEGRNIGDVSMKEQGPIYNTIVVAGEGVTWGDRITSETEDAASRDTYGYREYFEMQSGVKLQATLDANAEELLAFYKDPRNVFKIKAVDNDPARFSEYAVGDTLRCVAFLQFSEWAFDGNVRVIAREWTPKGECRLEVSEV